MRIAAVGDISLADQPLCIGHGVRSVAERRGHDWLFRKIKGMLADHDHVLGNLEKVIGCRDQEGGFRARMNKGSWSAAEGLERAGFSVVSLANNHIFEHGPKGIEETVDSLERAGIQHIGTRPRPSYVVEKRGTRVAFIAWSLIPDAYWPDLNPRGFYNLTDQWGELVNAVERAKQSVDHVVISLHWGNEFVSQPSIAQQELGRRLVDAGASAVVGHHPHVVQPVEEYKGGVIAYSLGNFIFDSIDAPGRLGAVLEIDLRRRVEWRCHPVLIADTYQPTPVGAVGESSWPPGTVPGLDPMEDADYRNAVMAARWRYRRAALVYFLRNAWRYNLRDLGALVIWGLKRVMFILKIHRKEREDPSWVYRGPMK